MQEYKAACFCKCTRFHWSYAYSGKSTILFSLISLRIHLPPIRWLKSTFAPTSYLTLVQLHTNSSPPKPLPPPPSQVRGIPTETRNAALYTANVEITVGARVPQQSPLPIFSSLLQNISTPCWISRSRQIRVPRVISITHCLTMLCKKNPVRSETLPMICVQIAKITLWDEFVTWRVPRCKCFKQRILHMRLVIPQTWRGAAILAAIPTPEANLHDPHKNLCLSASICGCLWKPAIIAFRWNVIRFEASQGKATISGKIKSLLQYEMGW